MRVTFPRTILAQRYLSFGDPIRTIEEYRRNFGNRCNRRHCEFISIFNLIRNSFATISQTASSQARAVPPSPSPPSVPLRAVDLSLDLFQRPPTSPLSLVVPGSHSFRYISLMELPYRSPPLPTPCSILLQPLYPSPTPRLLLYRCRFLVPFTRLISRYLRLPSSMYSDTPSWSPPLHLRRPFILICSAKFLEKTTISPTETQPAGDDYFTIEAPGRLLYSSYYTLDR